MSAATAPIFQIFKRDQTSIDADLLALSRRAIKFVYLFIYYYHYLFDWLYNFIIDNKDRSYSNVWVTFMNEPNKKRNNNKFEPFSTYGYLNELASCQYPSLEIVYNWFLPKDLMMIIRMNQKLATTLTEIHEWNLHEHSQHSSQSRSDKHYGPPMMLKAAHFLS